MSLEPGREVERYVVQGLLGEGGMAEVYRVRHSTLGTNHALKILTISSRSVRERLIQEGRLQATLRHPNIVAVTDVLLVDGAPALLMEFIEGPALDTWLMSYRPTLDEALTVFSGIVAGVRSAHNKGLIHRDLKPANVLMHIEDGSVVPKVADFGLAKAVEGDGGMSKTKSGSTMGTPAYMAPEQIRDASKVDKRADIFSLGCILYELVCGQQCFQGDDIITLFNKIADSDFIPASELVPDLPKHIEDAILGCLELDQEKRIGDCKELIERLERPEGSNTRIPMPTILPEDTPGAEAARSMVSVASFEDVPAGTSSPSTHPSETWIAEPEVTGNVAVESMVSNTGGNDFAQEQPSSEIQTEISQLRRQSMMMMGGTLVASIVVVVLAVAGATVALIFALNQTPEQVVLEVPVEDGDTDGTAEADPDEGTDTEDPEADTEDPEADTEDPEADTEDPENGSNADAGSQVEAPDPGPSEPPRDQRGSGDRGATMSGGGRPRRDPPKNDPPPEDTDQAPVETEPTPPPRPKGATIQLDGDARMVVLVGNGGKYKTNEIVPAGTYDIQAWFGGTQPVAAGRVTLSEGDSVKLKCVSLMAQCVRQ